jgi:hypothetical protein
MKSDLIDLTMFLHHETPRAILVSDDGIRDNAVWIPKSRCETVPEKNGVDRSLVIVTLAESLALEKGLI